MKQTIETKLKLFSPVILAAVIILCYLLTEGLKLNEVLLLHESAHLINVLMGVLIIIGLLVFHCRVRKTGQTEELIRLILFAGLVMRIGYMLYTDAYTRPHDISGGHDSYILQIIHNARLPQDNHGQFYQQPVYYVISAIVSAIVNAILGTSADEHALVNAAKIVSCFASCSVLLMTPKICKELDLNRRAQPIVLAVTAFLPEFYLLAGRVGPDSLSIYFMILALLLTIRWFKNQTFPVTIQLAVVYGLAISTKISCAVFAIFTAVLMLIRLVQAIKQKKAAPMLAKLGVFGCISLPLGMWYCIRNLVRFDQALNYVYPISITSDLYCGDHSIASRFLWFDIANLKANQYASPWNDYNYPMYLVKSSVFGEFKFGIPDWVSYGLVLVNFALILISLLAMIYVVVCCTHAKPMLRFGIPALWMFLYGFSVNFNINYPFGCTMDFRYIVPTAIFGGLCLSVAYNNSLEQHQSKLESLAAKTVRCVIPCLTAVFSALSVYMYCVIR